MKGIIGVVGSILLVFVLVFSSASGAPNKPHPTRKPKHTPTPTVVITPTPTTIPTPTPTQRPTPTPTQRPTPTPTVAPTPTPTVAPTSTPNNSDPMPTGDLPGWKLIFNDDFLSNLAQGGWPGPYANRWWAYPSNWHDTSGNGTYSPDIISAANGFLDINIKYENGLYKVAAIVPNIVGTDDDQLYGRYAVRFRADSMPGYKGAWLLWPQSETWPRDGEIDFPEGAFDGTISGYVHHQGATSSTDQDAFSTMANWQTTHTAVTEWSPNLVKFYLDGTLIGQTSTRIPNTPMHWVLQNETRVTGGLPSTSVTGHVQIDWVAVWAYNGVTPTPTPTVAPTPTPLPTPTPVPTPTPTPGAGVVIAAIGDIHGEGSDSDSVATNNLVNSINPSAILGLGDYQYTSGTCSNFMAGGHYNSDWGAQQARIYNTFGATHDYNGTSEAFNYFSGKCSGQTNGSAAGARLFGGTQPVDAPYSFDISGWHIIQLPSYCFRTGGSCSIASINTWLQNDLAAHKNACTIAFEHEPYWSSPTSTHSRTTTIKPWVQTLYDNKVEMFLSGHQHMYERFAPQNLSDQVDPLGVQQFIVGTGGIGFYSRTSTAANSLAYQASHYGVLKLTLKNGSYDWLYVSTDGAYSDSGTRSCN